MLWWTLRQLKSTNWVARERAAEKLGNSPDPRAIEALVATLNDSDSNVRKAAAIALQSLGWKPADETLRLHLAIEQQDWEELVTLGKIAVEPLLAIALKHRTPAAADALCKIGSVAVEPLIAALKDQEKNGKIAIMKMLGKIRDTRAVKPLLTVLKAEESDAREAAATALKEIGTPESEQAVAEYHRQEQAEANFYAAIDNGILPSWEILRAVRLQALEKGLKTAIEGDFVELVQTLVGAVRDLQQPGGGTDLNARISGEPLLHLAVNAISLKVVEWLLRHGAQVDAYYDPVGTPLHHIIVMSYVERDRFGVIRDKKRAAKAESILQLLIKHGADVNAEGGNGVNGHRPLKLAQEYELSEICQILRSHGAWAKGEYF